MDILAISVVVLWVVVCFNLLLTVALIRRVTSNQQPSLQLNFGPKPGQQAPDFSAETLDNSEVTLQTYRGRPTTLVFVGTSCSPCLEALPTYEELGHNAISGGENFILVSVDSMEQTKEFAREHNVSLPVIVAPEKTNPFFQSYQMRGTPSYCQLDARGIVQSSGRPHIINDTWQRLTDSWSADALSGSGSSEIVRR